jgi:translation initiation factor IF-3
MSRPANTDPKKSRLPRDDEITAWSVTVVDADQKLSEPRLTSAVLESFDHKTHSLVVVVPGEEGVPPICKIVNKKKEWAAAKAKKRQQSSGGAAPSKTLELNWAIEHGDLQHRLQRMRDFLEKGFKLEIVLAPKRRGRQATAEEAQGLLSRIREVVNEVGARESKSMEGKMNGVLTLYTEGNTKKK